MLKVVKHPIIQEKLTVIRDKFTQSYDFRQAVFEVTQILSCYATANLDLNEKKIDTPICQTIGYTFADKIVAIPILRAGLGMEDGFRSIVKKISTSFIGVCRNEVTLQPEQYYVHLPETLSDSEVFILDPMLATGGSLKHVIELVKEKNPKKITVITIISSPEGVSLLELDYPEIEIYTASLDACLNEKGYIVPGLGDAGDRIFNS